MFGEVPVLSLHPDPHDPGNVEHHLADLEHARRAENIACHRKVLAALDLWEHRMLAAADAGADAVLAGNDAFSEISARLRCSHTAARTLVETGSLLLRMPILADTFAHGDIDYANLRTVTSVLGDDASRATLTALDNRIARAATHFTPSALRAQVWKAWQHTAPGEAADARARRAASDRCAYLRRDGNGLSWLTACLTDTEGTAADNLITEITTTVCPADPRTRAALRADGFMALLHGEAALTCRCDNPDCPKSGRPQPARRAPLIQILVDADTLLGLADNPATLSDGTPIDAELARTLAEDATWQTIITETRRAVTEAGRAATETGEAATETRKSRILLPSNPKCGSGGPEHTVQSPEHTVRSPGRAVPSPEHTVPSPEHAIPAPERTLPSAERTLLSRGRTRRAGRVLHRLLCTADREIPTGAADLIDHWTDALDRRPVCARAADSDGHGGLHDPPPGALIYQPRSDVAALVRAQHPTCAFPGCTTSSRHCELDHVRPFDHDDPIRGGWTVPANLQPLCKKHHDLKSHRYWICNGLPGGAHHWRHHTGVERITVPDSRFVIASEPLSADRGPDPAPSHSDPFTAEETVDLLYEETWWERHMTSTDHPGNDPTLITHYREHQAILARRTALQPAPF